MQIYSGRCHTCGAVKHNIKVAYVMEDGDVFAHTFCDCGGVLVKVDADKKGSKYGGYAILKGWFK